MKYRVVMEYSVETEAENKTEAEEFALNLLKNRNNFDHNKLVVVDVVKES